MLKTTVKNKIDILFFSERKLDDSFLIRQFCVDRFTTLYRLDRNEKCGGITLFVRENIPSAAQEMKFSIKDFFSKCDQRI